MSFAVTTTIGKGSKGITQNIYRTGQQDNNNNNNIRDRGGMEREKGSVQRE